jgi:hypothetical protein
MYEYMLSVFLNKSGYISEVILTYLSVEAIEECPIYVDNMGRV